MVLATVVGLAGCAGGAPPVATHTTTMSPTFTTPGAVVRPTPSPGSTSPATSPMTSPSATTPGVPEVRIVVVELSPEDPMPGGTFVILANTGAAPMSVDCWQIRIGGSRTLGISAPRPIPVGGGLRLAFDRGDVADPDQLELLDAGGIVIDKTPLLRDGQGDDRVLSPTGGAWKLGRPPLPSDISDGSLDTAGSTCR